VPEERHGLKAAAACCIAAKGPPASWVLAGGGTEAAGSCARAGAATISRAAESPNFKVMAVFSPGAFLLADFLAGASGFSTSCMRSVANARHALYLS
jgi:hypothetical protein